MIRLIMLSFLVLLVGSSKVKSATVEELCAKKESNLTCDDLGYTITNPTLILLQSTCTKCPLDDSKFSCATKKVRNIQSFYKLCPISIGLLDSHKTCEKFPSCESLGYVITKALVQEVPFTYSCSACPFDGNMWACASAASGLVTVVPTRQPCPLQL